MKICIIGTGAMGSLGSPEKVAAILGTERVIVGIAGGFGASIKAPGHVQHNGMEFVHLGELNGPKTPRLEKVATVCAKAPKDKQFQ